MIKKIFLFIVLVAINSNAFFNNEFEITYNEKNQKIIVDRSLLENISIENYINHLSLLLEEAETKDLDIIPTCNGAIYEPLDSKSIESFNRAMNWLKKTGVSKLLKSERFIKFFEDLSKITESYTKDKDYIILANLDDPKYFYSQQFGEFLEKQIKGLIKNQIELAPYLKILKFISDDYVNFIIAKKQYRQNVLSFYLLEDISRKLTEQEVGRALSSIEDSKLKFGFKGISRSRKIKKDFDGYGLNLISKNKEAASLRLQSNIALFSPQTFMIAPFFQEVLFQGESLVLNTLHSQSKKENKPSLAMDRDCPYYVYDLRKNYEIVRIGLEMSPIPYSSRLFSFVKNRYMPQAMTEGFLAGYYKLLGQEEDYNVILRQSMNPLF